MQRKIPCVIMRGGTSRGPYFVASDLPADVAGRDAVLLNVMGSPHPLQVDGIGGTNTLTSKVAIVSPSRQKGADVDYLFAQVSVNEAKVDTNPNCGNMLSGVGPFAIEAGMVKAGRGETLVRIFNVNTQSFIEAIIQTPGGRVEYEGDARIDGVPGTGAPIKLNFLDAKGAVTGKMFPTGKPIDMIQGIEVTCLDMAMPMMLVAAGSMSKSGAETPAELDADKDFLAKLESMRLEAGRLMGMGDVTGKVVPKVGLLSAPGQGGSIRSRYFTPLVCHKAHAVTGAVCVASACALPGTVARKLVVPADFKSGVVRIEHPSGAIEVDLQVSGQGDAMDISRASLLRTARRIFEGNVLVPERLYSK
ncbi:MAG: 4-oxalomesaconate tautomerase [Proteobacteria bacterium]|nr:4-oxalomesaconate tautomerase [Pseudomonadota bacterium]